MQRVLRCRSCLRLRILVTAVAGFHRRDRRPGPDHRRWHPPCEAEPRLGSCNPNLGVVCEDHSQLAISSVVLAISLRLYCRAPGARPTPEIPPQPEPDTEVVRCESRNCHWPGGFQACCCCPCSWADVETWGASWPRRGRPI